MQDSPVDRRHSSRCRGTERKKRETGGFRLTVKRRRTRSTPCFLIGLKAKSSNRIVPLFLRSVLLIRVGLCKISPVRFFYFFTLFRVARTMEIVRIAGCVFPCAVGTNGVDKRENRDRFERSAGGRTSNRLLLRCLGSPKKFFTTVVRRKSIKL